jgi:hypothetical protein
MRHLFTGLAVVVAALVAAGSALYVRPLPREVPGGGLQNEQGIGLALQHEGFSLATTKYSVDVNETTSAGLFKCGGVEVTAVFRGTSGFWADPHRPRDRARFVLAFTGDEI